MTGCGTQVDPFQDDAADALEVADLACDYWNSPIPTDVESYSEEWWHNVATSAFYAGREASHAAALDPRWRTLADSFPHIARLAEQQEDYQGGSDLSELALQELIDGRVYVHVADSECAAVAALRGEELEDPYGRFLELRILTN